MGQGLLWEERSLVEAHDEGALALARAGAARRLVPSARPSLLGPSFVTLPGRWAGRAYLKCPRDSNEGEIQRHIRTIG